jgi:hypothetical protein
MGLRDEERCLVVDNTLERVHHHHDSNNTHLCKLFQSTQLFNVHVHFVHIVHHAADKQTKKKMHLKLLSKKQ